MNNSGKVAEREAPHLVGEEVTAGYGRVPIVQAASLRVGQGEVVVVLGPNGAGKTTLLQALTGRMPLMGGRVLLGGQDVSTLKADERVVLGLGYVPQVKDVFMPLSVKENLEMGGYRLGRSALKEGVEGALEVFPPLARILGRRAATLSGGQRKMLAIARALVPGPTTMVLDEPSSNLAPAMAEMVLSHVVPALAARGRAVLLIEQRVRLALSVASWAYVMVNGRIVISEAASELRQRDDLTSIFLSTTRTPEGRPHSGVEA